MQLLEIPYERQEDDWKCGAASLCMVYRSFGLDCTQGDVWPDIQTAYTDRARRGARFQAVLLHVLQQGFPVLGLRAARPWRLLGRCFAPDLRVILFHRRRFDSSGLHASVLRGLDEGGVVLQDPNGRPDRYLLRDDFLALWGPNPSDAFGRGYLLCVIARAPVDGPPCSCGHARPETIPCPHCPAPIPLQPGVAAGCGRVGCCDIDWEELLCPFCDCCLTRLTAV